MKYIVRMTAMVEVEVEAESMEAAMEACDLNEIELTPKAVCEIYNVIEAEETE